MSRLTIDITEQQHKTLKAMAALQGKTIKEYALERLFPARNGRRTSLGGFENSRRAKDRRKLCPCPLQQNLR